MVEKKKAKARASSPKSDSYKYWTHAKKAHPDVQAINSKLIDKMIAAKKKQK